MILHSFNTIYQTYIKKLHLYLGDDDELGDVSVKSYEYLYAIDDLQSTTITELANYLGLKKSSVSTMIDQMIKNGSVEKKSVDADKRSFTITLTDKANRLISEEKKFYDSYISNFSNYLTKLESQQFEQLLLKVAKGLNHEKT